MILYRPTVFPSFSRNKVYQSENNLYKEENIALPKKSLNWRGVSLESPYIPSKGLRKLDVRN